MLASLIGSEKVSQKLLISLGKTVNHSLRISRAAEIKSGRWMRCVRRCVGEGRVSEGGRGWRGVGDRRWWMAAITTAAARYAPVAAASTLQRQRASTSRDDTNLACRVRSHIWGKAATPCTRMIHLNNLAPLTFILRNQHKLLPELYKSVGMLRDLNNSSYLI